jgi:hypothetical protein
MTDQQNELYDSLTDYWQKIVDDLVKSLYDVGRVASGATAQSIGALNPMPITLTSTGFKVQISMPKYYQFIDEGVSGTKNNTNISRFKYKTKLPNISAIRKFMVNRGINDFSDIKSKRGYKPKNTTSGKRRDAEEIRKSIAYVIARSIFENGVEPTNFYSNVINDQELIEFERQLFVEYRKYIVGLIKIN